MSDIYKSPERVMVEFFDLPIVISKKFVHFPVGYETSLCNFISHKLMLVFKWASWVLFEMNFLTYEEFFKIETSLFQWRIDGRAGMSNGSGLVVLISRLTACKQTSDISWKFWVVQKCEYKSLKNYQLIWDSFQSFWISFSESAFILDFSDIF